MQVSCNYKYLFSVFAAIILLSAPIVNAQTLVMVRHAEKLEPWPAADQMQPLSLEGSQRAQHLRDVLSDLEIKAVFTSNTTRTIATGLPTAVAHQLDPIVHPACGASDSLAIFLDFVMQQFDASDFILVVSHSNIIPKWLLEFGIDPIQMTDMGISYDNRYNGYLVDGYDGLWLAALPHDPKGKPMVRYAKMTAY